MTFFILYIMSETFSLSYSPNLETTFYPYAPNFLLQHISS